MVEVKVALLILTILLIQRKGSKVETAGQNQQEPQVETETVTIPSTYFAYITTELYRPLKYICEDSKVLCDFYIIRKTEEEDSDNVSVKGVLNRILNPYPTMCGSLRLCLSPTDFRSMHRNIQNVFCRSFGLGTSILPSKEEANDVQLEMDTYYMTNKNYEEMRKGLVTRVIIPYHEDSEYKIPLKGVLYHHTPRFGCILRTPFGIEKIDQQLPSRYISIFTYEISGSLNRQSGIYSYICRGLQRTFVTGYTYSLTVNVSLHITFIEELGIFIEGENDFEKVFSASETSGSFIINVYTTYPVTSFEITKDEGQDTKITANYLSYPEFQIIAKYQIEIPVLDYTIDGTYTISVNNMDKKTKEQKIRLVKAQKLDIYVSPTNLEVVEGFIAIFECFIEGNLIGEINWSRDHEFLNNSKYVYKTENITYSSLEGLRITFYDLNLENSGKYLCTGSNQFETVKKAVELVVWPYENIFLVDIFSEQLNATGASMEAENVYVENLANRSTTESISTSTTLQITLIAGIAVGAILLAVLMIVFSIGYLHSFCKCMRRRKSLQKQRHKKMKNRGVSSDGASELLLAGLKSDDSV